MRSTISSYLAPELLLLLLLLVFAGCQGYKPLINPNVPELVITEGDPLEITCTSIGEIDIHYPETNEIHEILTSEHEIQSENQTNGSVKLKFRRPNSVFGDTGYYGCANGKADTSNKDYDNPNVSWLYVYVKSNQSAFAQEEYSAVTIPAMISEDLFLSCRPTSPELHVDLLFNYQKLNTNERISFDPKKGFLVKRLVLSDGGLYECRIERDGYPPAIVHFNVLPQNKVHSNPPIILPDGLEHVTAGSSLHAKCNFIVSSNQIYEFEWTTPRNSTSRIVLPPTQKQLGIGTKQITSELVEEHVTYDDEGDYICSIKVNREWKSSKPVFVHIYDPDMKYINLTAHDENRYLIVKQYKSVKFTVDVNGYPKPILAWFDPRGNELHTTDRITIDTKDTSASLEIRNVKLMDSGIYSLQAENDAIIKYLNYTLEVHAAPVAMILESHSHPSYWKLNEKASFTCAIKAAPTPNVTWIYEKCPTFQSLVEGNCENSTIEESIDNEVNPSEFRTTVEVITDKSGKIHCTACNIIGCNTATLDIGVSDGVTDGFLGIVEPEEKIVVEDEFSVLCTGSVYNLSSVHWLFSNETPVSPEPGRISVTYQDTEFTHQTNLTFSNVRKSDQGSYYCKALDFENQVQKEVFQLTVHDPEKPYFIESMNNSEQILNFRDAATNHRQLRCQAGGLPKPVITWLKDDVSLEANEQFSFPDKHVLEIKYLFVNDSGKYSCKAKNRYGQEEAFVKFIIKSSFPTMWVAIVISVIVILTILLIYFCVKTRRERRMRKELIDAGLMHFEEGALDCINPELTVDDQAELLPYDRKWEFPREKLKLGKQLGCGAFGVVMKAQAQGIMADESVTTVAVKMVRRNAEPAYVRALASELKIMVHLGKHLNVVNLLGACTNNIAKRELLVIVEYCRFGNLHNYLLRHRGSFINQIDPETGKIDPLIGKELLMRSTSTSSDNRVKYAALSFSRSLSAASDNSAPGMNTVIYSTDTQGLHGIPNENFINSNGEQPGWRSNYRGDYKDKNLKPICTQDLLSWAFQVARGMEYLSQRKVLHGDLAARNILLAENNVVKICDFGLAKTMYKDNNYTKKGDGPVPIKWMAIESIRDHVFSTQSDVWSFGIVLWEFFTLSEQPYPGMQAELQYQKLMEGYRMEQPQYATEDIYDIMLQCWRSKPGLRPTFSELVYDIGELLEENVKAHYVELNSPYVDMNTVNLEGKNDILTMMSSPDHAALTSTGHTYVNMPNTNSADSAYLSLTSPVDESGGFHSRPGSTQDNARFQFPSSPVVKIADANHSDTEESPMLKKVGPKEEPEQDEDNYLKPIDIHKKREEFVRKQEAEKQREMQRSSKSSNDRDSGYCNTPKGLDAVHARIEGTGEEKNEDWRTATDPKKPTVIYKTQDNYVNMPQQKTELNRDVPDSFMNPSYILFETSKSSNV